MKQNKIILILLCFSKNIFALPFENDEQALNDINWALSKVAQVVKKCVQPKPICVAGSAIVCCIGLQYCMSCCPVAFQESPIGGLCSIADYYR